MTPEQFAYWLQGFAEIAQDAPSENEWTIIKDHLALVFDKKTPNRIQQSPGLGAMPQQIGPNRVQPLNPIPTQPYNPAPATPWTQPPTIIC